MSDWNLRRAKLNHDLLKNRVIPSAVRLGRIIERHVIGDGLTAEACGDLMRVWQEFMPAAEGLLTEFDPRTAISRMFGNSRLTRLDRGDADWMREMLAGVCGAELAARRDRALSCLDGLNAALCTAVALGRDEAPAIDTGSAPGAALAASLNQIRDDLHDLSQLISGLSYNEVLRSPAPAASDALLARAAF